MISLTLAAAPNLPGFALLAVLVLSIGAGVVEALRERKAEKRWREGLPQPGYDPARDDPGRAAERILATLRARREGRPRSRR